MQKPAGPTKPVQVFIAYSRTDEPLKEELVKHLSPLRRQGLIRDWHDRRIAPGVDWNREIDAHLSLCVIFLPLISADFINSDYCYGIEMQRALERHQKEEALVIPVILRPCDWMILPFGRLQALPKDGKAVTRWDNQDEGFTDVARGIRIAVETILGSSPRSSVALESRPAAQQSAPEALMVTDSPRALVWHVEARTIAYMPVQECEWGNREVVLELEPDDPTDGPFLDSLRGDSVTLILAYRNNAAISRVREITHIAKAAVHRWRLTVQVERSDFTPAMEVGFEGISKDELAKRRARRLLLNENPAKRSTDLNVVAKEVLLRGVDTALPVEQSALPALFQTFGKHATRFLEIAWIDTVMRLKLSACIVEVIALQMELVRGALKIQFHGRRKREYANQPAFEMKVEGECKLL